MTPEQIAAGASCFQCLNEDQKRAAVLYLLDLLTTGGSGGSGLFVKKAGDTMTGRLVSPNINYTAQGSTPSAPASGFVEFADSTGRKSWIRGSDGFVRTWDSTLTANRVFSLPDATTTIAGLAVAQTFTLANTFSANGALNTPAVSFTGTAVSGGTATTTKPLVLLEPAGTSSTNWNTNGTMVGINVPNTFSASGLGIDFQRNGASVFSVTGGGTTTAAGSVVGANLVTAGLIRGSADSSTFVLGSASDVILARDAANALGQRNSTTAQRFSVYGTYTSAASYRRLTMTWNTSTGLIMAEGATSSDGSVAFNDAALATNATVGFVMIPSCAGTPTGVPADIPTGQIPMVYDSTNNRLYLYNGSWRSVAVA